MGRFQFRTGVIQVRRQLLRETTGLVVRDTKTARSRRAINLPRPMLEMLKTHRARQAAERLSLGLPGLTLATFSRHRSERQLTPEIYYASSKRFV